MMFVALYCIYPLEHLRAWVSVALAGLIVVLGGLFVILIIGAVGQ